jgi:hypothetical protein
VSVTSANAVVIHQREYASTEASNFASAKFGAQVKTTEKTIEILYKAGRRLVAIGVVVGIAALLSILIGVLLFSLGVLISRWVEKTPRFRAVGRGTGEAISSDSNKVCSEVNR